MPRHGAPEQPVEPRTMPLSASGRGTIAFLGVYGLGFFVSLCLVGIVGVGFMPLFPLQLDNLAWAQTWLIQTIFDYYGASICVCSIIISTEPELVIGIGWTLAICLLGCPNACVWAAVQLYQRGSLRLASGPDEASGKDGLTGTDVARSTGSMLGIAWFLVYAVFFIIMLVVTMYKRNLFDLDFGDLSWCIWWLMTTCFDYYGCCTVLVACMLSTEEELHGKLGWSCLALFLGTPGSCLWIIRRVYKADTLSLARVDGYAQEK